MIIKNLSFGIFVVFGAFGGNISKDGCMIVADEKRAYSPRIEALVSKNIPPILTNAGAKIVAEFPPSFDWNEQKRVFSAVKALWEDTSEGEWEELVSASDDNRYSVTVRITELPDAGNLTVGDLCSKLARKRLIGAAEQHLCAGVNQWVVYEHIGIKPLSLKQWRLSPERSEMQLHLLQVEVNNRAIKFIQKRPSVKEADKLRMVKAIEAETAAIEKTGEPYIEKSNARWLDLYRKSPNE